MQDLNLDILEIFVSEEVINTLYTDGIIELDSAEYSVNNYALLINKENLKHTAIAKYNGNNKWTLFKRKNLKFETIMPKDIKQSIFMDCLQDNTIPLVTAIGQAGTGKTTIALAYALSQYTTNKRPIYLTKPTIMVGAGKAFGPVPGDIDQKYAPYLTSYEIVLKKILGNGPSAQQFLALMKEREHLQFMPIELARGCTFENCTLILDEAQNMSWHELNTIITRIGDKSKIIILGDLGQIDTGLNYKKTGLYKMLSAAPFQKSSLASSIELTAQYRSAITQLAIEISQWISTQ